MEDFSLRGGLRILTEEELEYIGISMFTHFLKSLPYRPSDYTFKGNDAVNYLVEAYKLATREEAVFIGQQVMEQGIFYSVIQNPKPNFCDKFEIFCFDGYWVDNVIPRSQGLCDRPAPNIPPQTSYAEENLLIEQHNPVLSERHILEMPQFDINHNPEQPKKPQLISLLSRSARTRVSASPIRSEFRRSQSGKTTKVRGRQFPIFRSAVDQQSTRRSASPVPMSLRSQSQSRLGSTVMSTGSPKITRNVLPHDDSDEMESDLFPTYAHDPHLSVRFSSLRFGSQESPPTSPESSSDFQEHGNNIPQKQTWEEPLPLGTISPYTKPPTFLDSSYTDSSSSGQDFSYSRSSGQDHYEYTECPIPYDPPGTGPIRGYPIPENSRKFSELSISEPDQVRSERRAPSPENWKAISDNSIHGTHVSPNPLPLKKNLFSKFGSVACEPFLRKRSQSLGSEAHKEAVVGGEDRMERMGDINQKDELAGDQVITTKKKRKISNISSAEEKKLQRAEKSRNASRLYRQRKKQYIEELKQQLERSHSEQNFIAQDIKQQNELMSKLVEENSHLKRNIATESFKFEEQRKQLLKELEDSISQNSSTEVIDVLLKQINVLDLQISKTGMLHLEELVSPTTIMSLLYNPSGKTKIPIISQTPEGGISDFAKKLLENTPNLSTEQQLKIESIVQKHKPNLEIWKTERKNIDEEIEAYFNKGFSNNILPKDLNVQELFGLKKTLQALRQNMDSEANAWAEAVAEFQGMLTSQQRASFLIYTEHMHSSLQQLEYLWGLFHL